ncbi:LAME_0D04060g1_1 [Lachancea meyersii CBS 8951]|uniref:LAME_0D04060g1_1 n=1 Tax=Lachancea meyersii CBS 8951 TaxID=1266667 RepID=A0A1G4J8L3_9SACH|nr:LAME_0D04060g1_1 [Lachancea meyersii CBS 8951]
MSRALIRHGGLLDIGKFVSRYGYNADPAQVMISADTIYAMEKNRYSSYLNSYNCFVLLRHGGNRFEASDQKLLWRSFCGEIDSFYRRFSALASSDFTVAPSPVFFESPPKTSILSDILGVELEYGDRQCFCSFQNLNSLDSTSALRLYLEHTKASKSPARFEPIAIGIKMVSPSSAAIACIQPLLEESSQMYQGFNYEKLLEIAKRSQTSGPDPMRKEVKGLLEVLAGNRLLTPRLAKLDRWLLLTADHVASATDDDT